MHCKKASFSFPLSFVYVLHASLGIQYSSEGDTISWGQSLIGEQTLVSKEGHFELGFFSPGNSKRYYIGIWYKKLSPQTVIWVANREVPIYNTSSSELKITENGSLALFSNNRKLVWSSNSVSYTANSTVAVLLDTGNIVLRNHSNSSAIIWQSFDHPTDTWVPGGWVGMNKITGEYQRLTSWKNLEDPSMGNFMDTLDPSGLNQFILLWNGSETYWRSGVWNGHTFSELPSGDKSSAFVSNFIDNNKSKQCIETFNMKDAYTRVVMDPSGQVQQWLWTNSNQEWALIWSQPVDACDVYSVCGAFGICDRNSEIFCSCPPGFEPVSIREWNLSDWSSGCKRKTRSQCREDNNSTSREKEGFLAMSFKRLPAGSHPLVVHNTEECKLACLSSCSCTAYYYDSGCMVWNGDVRNLQQNINAGSTLHLRLAASDLPSSRSSHKWVLAVILSAVAALLFIFFFMVLGVIWMRRRQKRGGISMHVEGPLLRFAYVDLQRITNNFSEKLGGGGFGTVFKGTMPDSTIIAVKKLEGLGLGQGEKQFRAEVGTLGSIQHTNLLRLRGFCCEGIERLLVYDYMPGGSLDCSLSQNSKVLDWRTRYQIILGIARGIAYLHEKCRECIIHCDIKPGNILLDAEFCAKVADFGMAKLLGRDFSRVLTTIRGTVGYLAPEWISGLPITPKVDLYSFGMMLFELVSGQRNSSHSKSKIYFPSWAAQQVMEGDIMSLLDDRLDGQADMEELMRVCRVACWCIQESELDRPSMGQVVLILEGVLEVNTPPIPKTFQLLMQEDHQPELHFYNHLRTIEDEEQSENCQNSVVRSQNEAPRGRNRQTPNAEQGRSCLTLQTELDPNDVS